MLELSIVTLFDAMACGVAPVVGDLPSYDQIIVHERNGLRIPLPQNGSREESVTALANALIRLRKEPETRAAFIEAGKTVLHQYGIFETQMERMSDHYYRLAAQRQKPSPLLSARHFNETVYKMLMKVF